MRLSSRLVAVSAVFGVLVFMVELIPPPTSRFFQVFTALFITLAAVILQRLGGATFTCLIAGLLDAIYTGMPIAFLLFVMRGVSFDLALQASSTWTTPSTIKVSVCSILSSLMTGLVAYWAIVEWLSIMDVGIEIFVFFIVMSAVLSGIGAVIAVKLWQRFSKL